MLSTALSILAGNTLAQCLPRFPAPWELALLGAAFIIAASIYYRTRHTLLLMALLAVVSFTWTLFIAHHRLTQQLPTHLNYKIQTITARVTGLPHFDGRACRFMAVSNKLGRLRLSWYRPDCPVPGSVWRLSAKLHRPRGFGNPGSFDAVAFSLEQNIQASGYVIGKRPITQLKKTRASVFSTWRFSLKQKLDAALSDTPYRSFIEAITIGYRGDITPAQWQQLRRTGTNHLVAIAGLHIGFVALCCYGLGFFIWTRAKRACLYFPAPLAATIAAWLGGLLYAGLAGFSLPAQRALIMLSILSLARLSRRHIAPLNALSAALMVILILDPLATLTASFYLSFGAVFLIIYSLSYRPMIDTSRWAHLKRWWCLQWTLTLGLTPIIVFCFGQVSVVSIIANAIAIPIMGFMIIPTSLLACMLLWVWPALAHGVLQLSLLGAKLLWWLLHFLSAMPIAALSFNIPNVFVALSLWGGLILLLSPRGWPARYLGIVGLLPLLYWHSPPVPNGDVRLTVLDVGQGLSALIQTQHHRLLYDTGPRFSPNFNAGDAVILPFWQSQALHGLSILMLSHGDSDHTGGVIAVLNTLHPKQLLASVWQTYPRKTQCLGGMQWFWDGVWFRVLYPTVNDLHHNNNSSCVLQVKTKYHTLLLVGDIEQSAESVLLHRYPLLTADVLIAPHHGSKTSSTRDFVKAVHPKIVLIAAGFHNRYHFPSKRVLKRYWKIGARTYTTGMLGAITVEMGEKLHLTAYRSKAHHYWLSVV
jgi:competence protein ComEC